MQGKESEQKYALLQEGSPDKEIGVPHKRSGSKTTKVEGFEI